MLISLAQLTLSLQEQTNELIVSQVIVLGRLVQRSRILWPDRVELSGEAQTFHQLAHPSLFPHYQLPALSSASLGLCPSYHLFSQVPLTPCCTSPSASWCPQLSQAGTLEAQTGCRQM